MWQVSDNCSFLGQEKLHANPEPFCGLVRGARAPCHMYSVLCWQLLQRIAEAGGSSTMAMRPTTSRATQEARKLVGVGAASGLGR